MEFVINNAIKVHPLALTRFDQLKDEGVKAEIAAMTAGYANKADDFVDALARGLSRIAAFCFPKPVIVRMSDFKTNEYANLLGGRQFEPDEENPMIGFRGASRYYSDRYRDGFALECRAMKKLREETARRVWRRPGRAGVRPWLRSTTWPVRPGCRPRPSAGC
jgi:pyruvate,water dikinase